MRKGQQRKPSPFKFKGGDQYNPDLHEKYYVYAHYNADTNQIFYIGKGHGKRAWTPIGRTVAWEEAAEDGFAVRILESGIKDEFKAYEIENKFVEMYFGKTVNQQKKFTFKGRVKGGRDPICRCPVCDKVITGLHDSGGILATKHIGRGRRCPGGLQPAIRIK